MKRALLVFVVLVLCLLVFGGVQDVAKGTV